jgi:plastocyanin
MHMTRTHRRIGLALLLTATGLAAVAGFGTQIQASSGGASARSSTVKHQRTVHVTISNLAFKPARLVVSVGTKVAWTNRDGFQHTSTSDRGLWDSAAIDPGATFNHAFSRVGTFTYHCTIHPFMRGTVVVTR